VNGNEVSSSERQRVLITAWGLSKAAVVSRLWRGRLTHNGTHRLQFGPVPAGAAGTNPTIDLPAVQSLQ
jgi:hypothetical protein